MTGSNKKHGRLQTRRNLGLFIWPTGREQRAEQTCSKGNIVVLNKLINITLMSNKDSKTNYGHGKPAER
jgi:hypothetical protein